MRPSEFEAVLREASVIVAHAGIGTVLKAYKYRKPIILVPRQAAFGEHRNDLTTSRRNVAAFPVP